MIGLLVGCGILLLVVPGLVALSACFVAVPALMAERGLDASGAISRSGDLTRGRRWKVLAVALIFTLGVGAAAVAAAAGIGYLSALLTGRVADVAQGIIQIVAVIPSGISDTAPAIAYHDLRVAREGVSTEELAAVFE